MRNSLLNAAAAAALVLAASPAIAGTWVPIVPPANSSSASAFGLNNKNILTGDYVDASGNQHGFVGPFDGSKYTSFDDAGGVTQPRGLNDKGYITGYDTGTLTPWERTPKGTLTNVTKSGTTLDQLAQGINNSGVFAGNYTNQTTGLSVGYTGSDAKWTSDIKLSITNTGYAGRAIDTKGDVGGWYYDSSGVQHGLLIIGKKATTIDYPGAAATLVEGMNDNGIVSGFWTDTSSVDHGFAYIIKRKKFFDLNIPGSSLTQVWGINNNNVIAASSDVGSYVYCLTKKGCPSGARAAKTPPVHIKYTPGKP